MFCILYFQVFLLVSFFEEHTETEIPDIKDSDLPKVSITVPCFNESRTVQATVESLRALNYPQEKLSILIVDDGSTDSTFSIAQSLEKKYSNVTAVRQENGGKYTALNRGIKQSDAEYVGCLDADSFVHPDALRNMIRRFHTDPNTVAVTPAMKVHNPQTLIQKMQSAEYMIGIFAKSVMGKINAIHVTPGPFSIFKKSIFEEIGYFKHAHMTEDMEIAFRIHKHRYTITHCPEAFVYTITPNTARKLYKQRTRWVYGFIKNAIDYRNMLANPKYGNMAMFTLPYAVFGILATFFLMGTAVAQAAEKAWINIERISSTGFIQYIKDSIPRDINFDWFFINADVTVPLTFVMVLIAWFIMIQGRKMADGIARPSMHMVYFIVLYGFIAPFWLTKAVYKVIRSHEGTWR